jgi:2-phospho-L-lactate guanylyltransferase
MSATAVIIPLRGLHGGKSRLAPLFDPAQRSTLIASMARQVLAAVERSGVADTILVVSRDLLIAEHLPLASPRTSVVWQCDGEPGLNPAIDLGRQEAIRRGADRIVVLSADLPNLQPRDIRALHALDADVVLAPDRAGLGTNAIALRGHRALESFRFQFGVDSLSLHLAESLRNGLTVARLDVCGFAHDLDTGEDWDILSRETQRLLLYPKRTMSSPGTHQADRSSVAILEHA